MHALNTPITCPARLRAAVSLLAASLLAGCGTVEGFLAGDKVDYRSQSVKTAPLEIPPDLTQLQRDGRFVASSGAVSASVYQSGPTSAAAVNSSAGVAPAALGEMRIVREGAQRWLVVPVAADQLWPQLREFWVERGFNLVIDNAQAGVMETDWAENRAKIGSDIIRNALGRILDSLYSTGERDKFRTRFEPGETPGTTDVFISHRAMEEVYTSSAKVDTRWQPRAPDPELEAEMLRRLMVRLGSEEKRAEVSVAAAKAEPRAKLAKSDDGAGTLEVYERFDRAWRRVGLALDRVGFTVEDRDRTRGLYFVRYVDPEIDNTKKDDGWLSKLAFWKGSEPPASSKVQYRIHVSDAGQQSVVQVLSNEGGTDKSETSKKILALLLQQLQ